MNLFNLYAKISIDDKDYNSKIASAESKFQKVGQTLSGLNKTFLGVGTALGGVAGVATKFGMDFEAQMSKVGAISGASAKDMEQLSEKAKQMGATTKFSATESGEAFQYMAMAGWKTADMLDGITGVMNLASASGEDLAMVSDIVTDSMTAFGLSADKSAHFADVLAVASSNSNTNVAMLGESFKYVAPLAGSLGYTAEDTAKALGLMANAGIKGSMAGTALRSTLNRMVNQVGDVGIVMEELGISITDTNGEMKSLDDIMINLREAFSGLSEEQKAQYASTLAGQEAMSGFLAIVNASDKDFNNLGEAIKKADGTAEKMAQTMNDNLKGSFTILGSSLEALGIAFYDKFSEPLKNVVDKAIEGISKVTEKLASGELDGLLSGIAGAITGIGTALLLLNVAYVVQDLINVFKGLNAVTKIGTAVQMAFNAVMALNPFVAIGIAIAGVVTGLGIFIATNENARAKVAEIWGAIKGFFIDTWNSISAFFTETVPTFISNMFSWFGQLPEFIGQMWSNFKEICVSMFNSVISFFTETVPNLIGKIVGWFGELPYKIGVILGEVLGTMIKWGANAISFVVTEVPKIISNIVKFFAELPGKVGTWLLNTLNKVAEWSVNMIQKAIEVGTNFVSNVIKFIAELPAKIWSVFISVVNKAVQWGSNMVSTGIKAMKEFGSAVIGAIANLPSQFMEIGINIVKGVWNGITSMGGWIMGKVKDFFGGIVDGAKKVLDIHSPSRVFREIGKFVVEGFNVGIQNNAKSAVKTTENTFNQVVKKINVINSEIEKTNNKARKKALETQKKTLEAQKKTLESQLKTNKKIVEEMDKLADKTIESTEKTYNTLTDGIQGAFEKRYDSIANLRNKMWETLDQIEVKFEDTIKKIEEKKEQYAQSLALTSDLFKTDTNKLLDANKIIENSKKETEKLKTFYFELEKLLQKDFPTQLIEQMKNAGVSSIGQLQALNSMTAEQMAEFNKMYEERMEIANKLAQTKFESEMTQAEKDRQEAIKEAHKDYDEGLQKVYSDFDKRLIELAKKTGDSMNKVGKDMIDGLVKGANLSKDKATELAKKITANLTSAIRGEIDKALAYAGDEGKTEDKVNEALGNARRMIYNSSEVETSRARSVEPQANNVTINQYYNKPINEAESARLTRNEMRKLAIGVI